MFASLSDAIQLSARVLAQGHPISLAEQSSRDDLERDTMRLDTRGVDSVHSPIPPCGFITAHGTGPRSGEQSFDRGFLSEAVRDMLNAGECSDWVGKRLGLK